MTNPRRESAPASVRAPRFDLFRPIHKAIRLATTEMLARVGSTSFADPQAVAGLVSDMRAQLSWCEVHLTHEERIIKPAALERMPAGVEAFEAHALHVQALAELRALLDALERGPDTTRAATGRTLYLHFSVFVGENLVHMAEEERLGQPLLELFFDDAELRAIHGRIMEATAPADKAYAAPFLMRALDPDERRTLVETLARTLPPGAVAGMLASAREALREGELRALEALVARVQEASS